MVINMRFKNLLAYLTLSFDEKVKDVIHDISPLNLRPVHDDEVWADK